MKTASEMKAVIELLGYFGHEITSRDLTPVIRQCLQGKIGSSSMAYNYTKKYGKISTYVSKMVLYLGFDLETKGENYYKLFQKDQLITSLKPLFDEGEMFNVVSVDDHYTVLYKGICFNTNKEFFELVNCRNLTEEEVELWFRCVDYSKTKFYSKMSEYIDDIQKHIFAGNLSTATSLINDFVETYTELPIISDYRAQIYNLLITGDYRKLQEITGA